MALFSECMLKCARKLLDTADIVRDAMLRQLIRTLVLHAPLKPVIIASAHGSQDCRHHQCVGASFVAGVGTLASSSSRSVAWATNLWYPL